MKGLFKNWGDIERTIKGRSLMLFLDYDGTLVPIRKAPQKALISRKTRALLRAISKNKNIRLAIVSGRSLKNVKEKVGIRNIVYVGNHGFEIEGPKLKFGKLSGKYRKTIKEINGILKHGLPGIKGLLIEDKGPTISLHYRLVDNKDLGILKNAFKKMITPYLKAKKIKLNPGKKVYEIKPPINWDKGKAVGWLLKNFKNEIKGKKSIPVYMGDDVTDESAFKALRNKGITILVGNKKKSSAEYRVTGVNKAIGFLNKVKTIYE